MTTAPSLLQHPAPDLTLDQTLDRIVELDRDDVERMQAEIDGKTKPIGSLGALERLALQLARIQRSTRPRIVRPVMLVFAGDHGIAEQQVSPFPQAVTVQMVANFIAGGAAINALSGAAGMTLEVVNAGVASAISDAPNLINTPVAAGTRDFSKQAAMSEDAVRQALALGMSRVAAHAAQGSNTIAFGEMGIGNTSAAACLMHRLTGIPLAQCVGRGTGLDDAGLAHKRAVLEQALNTYPPFDDPLLTLATFGGFEIAAMTGAFLAAAARRMTIVVDGFVVSAALLVATRMAPAVREYCVFSHVSDEAGHRAMLDTWNATPLLSLGLRLGEGTGAALALPLVRAAAAFMSDMASFSTAGIAGRNNGDGDDSGRRSGG